MVSLHRVLTLVPVIAFLVHLTLAGSAEDCATDSFATTGAMALSELMEGAYAGSFEERALTECEGQGADCTVDVSSWYGADFEGRCSVISGKVFQNDREYTCTIDGADQTISMTNIKTCAANTCSLENAQELMSNPVAYSDYYGNVSCTGTATNIREGSGSAMQGVFVALFLAATAVMSVLL